MFKVGGEKPKITLPSTGLLSLWCRVHRGKVFNWKGVGAMMLSERILDSIVHLKFERGLSISFASGVASREEKLFN